MNGGWRLEGSREVSAMLCGQACSMDKPRSVHNLRSGLGQWGMMQVQNASQKKPLTGSVKEGGMNVIPKHKMGGRESCGVRGILQRGRVGKKEEYKLVFRRTECEF